MNWILICTLPFAVLLGDVWRRRRQPKAGQAFCNQPLWSYVGLILFLGAAGAFFAEATRVAIFEPSAANVGLSVASIAAALLADRLFKRNERRAKRD